MAQVFHGRSYTRRDALKLAGWASAIVAGGSLLAGCSSSSGSSSTAGNASASVSAASSAAASLTGKKLNIYCGAGMTDPFQEIANAFTSQTGCEMNITFANAAQIQTQIKTTEEGDFFIAGSADELQPVEKYVKSSKQLVKHIPVIAVPSANLKNIAGLGDLASCDRLLIGDPESTPIGKIAKKALTDAGIWDTLQSKNAITTTTTAPQISTALASGEGDAGIVWKENVKADGSKIIDTVDMDKYVKIIPAALLTCAADSKAADAFLNYLDTSEAQNIWKKYGYELA